jgi:lycopene cyclase domain-containing protein
VTYLAVLTGVVLGSGWLELVLRTRVCRRWRRLLATVLPTLVLFLLWDGYAVAAGHWAFDPARVLGLFVAGVPLEEVLFFVVVPVAAVLTLEAVRSATGWRVGDEAGPESRARVGDRDGVRP